MAVPPSGWRHVIGDKFEFRCQGHRGHLPASFRLLHRRPQHRHAQRSRYFYRPGVQGSVIKAISQHVGHRSSPGRRMRFDEAVGDNVANTLCHRPFQHRLHDLVATMERLALSLPASVWHKLAHTGRPGIHSSTGPENGTIDSSPACNQATLSKHRSFRTASF